MGSVPHLEGPASPASSTPNDRPYEEREGSQCDMYDRLTSCIQPASAFMLRNGEARLTPRTKNEPELPPNATVNVDGRKGENGQLPPRS